MEVKGTAVKSIQEFVNEKYPNEYNSWLNALPADSKTIIENRISLTSWYPIESSIITPTRIIGEMFFRDVQKAAFELGIYSSAQAIKGVYKMLVMVSSPSFIVNRASTLISSYYRPCKMEITRRAKDLAVVSITEFQKPNIIVDYRIYGWIKNTLEFSKFKSPKVEMLKSMGKGDSTTDYLITWNE
ncbi:MAG: hypothetical protein U0W24_24640 [Bacteroidales bacterium]